jgi:membrane protease YdiL (CAAX protease family)
VRAFLVLAGVVAAALLCGALISYPAWLLFSSFSDVPFHKLLSRATSLGALIWALLLLRVTGPFNAARAGFAAPFRSSWRPALAWFLCGLGVVLLLETLLVLFGVRSVSTDAGLAPAVLLPRVIAALCIGLVVGFVEELVYRGALYSALLRFGGAGNAILLTSLVYAAAHHVKIRELAPDVVPDWTTGFTQLAGAMWRYGMPQIVDGFIPLFLLGVLAALLRRHYGNLAAAIGLHAGLVAGIKLANQYTDFVPKARFGFLVNYFDKTLGWLASLLLLIVIAAFWLHGRRRAQPASS